MLHLRSVPRNNSVGEGGVGLLVQRKPIQLECRTFGDWQVFRGCGDGGAFVRGKHEGVQYLEESRERQRWEVGRQQNTPGTKVLFCSLP